MGLEPRIFKMFKDAPLWILMKWVFNDRGEIMCPSLSIPNKAALFHHPFLKNCSR